MNVLNTILATSKEIREITEKIGAKSFPLNISGASDSQKAHLIATVCASIDKKPFVVTYNEIQAKRLSDDLAYFLENKCVNIPPEAIVLYNVDAQNREMDNKRAAALGEFSGGKAAVVSIESLLHFVMPKNDFENMCLHFNYGGTFNVETLPDRLVEMGYSRVDVISDAGQFAIRGGIVDIYSPDSDMPVRMEFFGDEIDSVRYFDCETQLSTEKIKDVKILPVKSETARASMLSYLDDSYQIFLDEPQRVSESAKAVEWEIAENIKTLAEKNVEIAEKIHINSYNDIISEMKNSVVGIMNVLSAVPDYKVKTELSVTAKGLSSYSGNIEFFISDLMQWLKERQRVVILGGSTQRAKKIHEMLGERDIASRYFENVEELSDKYVTVTTGSITRGFEYPKDGLVVVSDREIFSAEKKKRRVKRDADTMKIKSADQLELGDYVVHNTHGIGRYLGIVRMKVNNVVKDYIKLEYRGEDYLYLPVGQLDSVSKYMGGENKTVRLNRMGSPEWANAKRKVRQNVEEMASRLVALYAERERSEGVKFSPDTPWQHDFEDQFPYEETEDQLISISEMKKDMESSRPMDRLLCGDVGYGKTEVAMRGAFKAVMEGYQVAYLVPTTILASQHYQNFVERMKEFPVTVRMLSRFCTPTESKKTLKMLQNGECDIVVGTHKLLSKNVIFKKLGFLIVDEEQRFGVTHKEKIKEMKKNVDVLTLSATPIPRTLHMAMIGIRDMSVLTSPPSDRYPVQTYVLEYNEAVCKNAIERELARGGQVYYLHNRVETIHKAAERVRALVPDARVGVAHGKMNETELDDVMMKVQDKEIDVLCCTTIIETGLDISNVNTIIIENADTLGLSQLYQLRGRVGRTNRLAYAYLTYKKNKMLDETAEKRLRAIREFTEFGSGFRIALRDLEIRGAGNVLGPEQHGFMASVGYDMYCTILEDAVNDAMGKPKREEKTETVIDLNVSAFIPDSYIPTSNLRIEAYKQIAAIENIGDRYGVEESFEDRYGEIPNETYALLDIQMIRTDAQNLGIKEISHAEGGIIFKLDKVTPEMVDKVASLASRRRGKILFGAGDNSYILLREKNLKANEIIESVNIILKDLQNEKE
ncbi:MAG: transcription-repair coupling factor [Clostridia bacterium]|nr:transcription-repair coupling factor [Clostridia bacterium]